MTASGSWADPDPTESPERIAARFATAGEVTGILPLGASPEEAGGAGNAAAVGHINKAWVVSAGVSGGETRYFLQRINERVFPDPNLVARNCANVLEHIGEVLRSEGCEDRERRMLTVVPARSGDTAWRDEAGGVWRMFLFIEGALARTGVSSPETAYAAARAYGEFQRRMLSYAGPPLHPTIAGFHDTAARVAALDLAIHAADASRMREAADTISAAAKYRQLADRYRFSGCPERIVHNDAKIQNILFDGETDRVLCVVDLDTVMPGLAIHDFGDMVRTMATRSAEDGRGEGPPMLDISLFEAVARGYLDATSTFLTDPEASSLLPGAQVIVYEQGIRFLTDFLRGDAYYRTSYPGENLRRAATQFAILGELLRHEDRLRLLAGRRKA